MSEQDKNKKKKQAIKIRLVTKMKMTATLREMVMKLHHMKVW